jgi:Hsp70 protein
MKDAGALAGLNVLRIINEPTAAAIAYKVPERGDRETRLLVLDLGGGTFDVTVLAQEDGVFEVLSNTSDRHLGGEDFNNRLLDHLLPTFEAKHPVRVREVEIQKDAKAMGELRKAVEIAKRALSNEMSTTVEIKGVHGGEDLREVITRVEFEELNADLFERIKKPIEQAIEEAGLRTEDIDEVFPLLFPSYIDPLALTFLDATRLSWLEAQYPFRKYAKWYRTISERSISRARSTQTRQSSMVLLSKPASSAVTWTEVGAAVST